MARERDRGSSEKLPKPTAQRLSKPSWRDSRLVIGVLLIAAATLGGAAFVNKLDDSVEVYRARTSLVPGQQLTRADVTTVRIRLDDVRRGYLPADRALPTGRVLREVRGGELVPASAVGSPAKVGVKAVAIEIDPSLASTLTRGSVVDVWVSAKKDQAGSAKYDPPVRMVQRAVVSRVPQERQNGLGMASGQRAAVHVLVPDASVNRVIGAVNTESKVTLVATADSPMRPPS